MSPATTAPIWIIPKKTMMRRIALRSRRGSIESSRIHAGPGSEPGRVSMGTSLRRLCPCQLLLKAFCFVMRNQPVHQRREFSVHHFRQLMQRQPDAVVRHAVLRKIVSADFLGAITGFDLP